MTSSEDSETPRLSPERWVEDHGDYLYNYAFGRLRQADAAEDAVQETLLAALKGAASFAGRSSERTWLVGILKHKIIDHLRKQFRETPVEDIESLPNEQEQVFHKTGSRKGHWIVERGPADWGNPAHFVERKEFWEFFQKCLEALPARFRSCYTLYEIDGEKADLVCKEFGISPSNLWVILHRTRKQLRRCLEITWIGKPPWPKEPAS